MIPNHSKTPWLYNLKRWAPLFITILILVVIILGYWGYTIHDESQNDKPLSLLSLLYDTILMFKMESYETGVYNWPLVIARYLATAIVGYGVYTLVISHFRKWWSRFKTSLSYHDHTIIAGLGLKGYLLAIDLHKAGKKVVVIESNPKSIYINRVRSEGIIVFISDGLDKRCWINAGLLRAERFILVMDSDDKNIEVVTMIAEIHQKRKEEKPLSGLVHIDNLYNFNLLKDYLDTLYGTTKLDINIFNTCQLAAQRIWDEYPPHDKSKDNPSVSEMAILIAGYNQTAEAFLVENMILSRYKDPENLRVLIVVPNSTEVGAELKRKYPFMSNYLNYEVINEKDDFFCDQKLIGEEDFNKINMVYVFGDEDAEVVLKAKKLKQCFYNRNFNSWKSTGEVFNAVNFQEGVLKKQKFIACLPEKTNVVEFLKFRPSCITNIDESIPGEKVDKKPLDTKLKEYLNISFFNQFSDCFTHSYLIDQNETVKVIAKVINYFYAIKYKFSNRLKWMLDQASITYDPNDVKVIIEKIEKDLLKLRLTKNDPINEIETLVFRIIREELKLPDYFSLEMLSLNYRWQLLTDRYEDSNLYAARHVNIKLLYPQPPKPGLVEYSDSEKNAYYLELAPMEHNRWMAEREFFQFRLGEFPSGKTYINDIIKDDLKLNDLMIPFDELDPGAWEKDYDLFRLLKLIKQIRN